MKHTKISRRHAHRAMLAAFLGVLGLSLAACDSGNATSATPTATTSVVGAAGVQSTLKEWSVELSEPELQAGNVAIAVTNGGKFTHNLVIRDADGELARTPNFKEGQQTLEVDLKPGTYTFLCDIPGHPEKGMTREVTVR